MNQLCRVCGEPAAGFHFGAFTCEGCKSFFGRTYNNLSQIHECKNGGSCVINKQNRTSCKACRLKKCVVVGMSKSGSKYGRRSNWFKIHCLLQEQAAQVSKNLEGTGSSQGSLGGSPTPMTSLSPTQMTSLSPGRTEDEGKVESSALSSPESIVSESSIDIHRRKPLNGGILPPREPFLREGVPGSDFVANLGLYSLHPGLSLFHASQLYSRLYSPVLYPAITHPHLLPTPPTPTPRSPPLSSSPPHSTTSPKHQPSNSRPSSSSPEGSPRPPPPSPPYSLQTGSPTPSSPFTPRKRGADSPLDDLLRPWHSASPSEQEAPIDLRVKRRRLSTHALHPPGGLERPPPTDSKGHPIMALLPLPTMTTTPVNLSSKA